MWVCAFGYTGAKSTIFNLRIGKWARVVKKAQKWLFLDLFRLFSSVFSTAPVGRGMPAFICCRRRFWKAFHGPNGPILAAFCRIMALKLPKTAGQTPQNQPKMRQNHPKMGFGGILDRLEAISIPSISISKGIKNKFRPILGPQVPTPLALIVWQRTPL